MDWTRSRECAITVEPGSFRQREHFYARVLHSEAHPVMSLFFGLDNEQIATHYCSRVNKSANRAALAHYLLNYKPKHFFWAGSDLLKVQDQNDERHMVLIETNSCPSGVKSMPILTDSNGLGGYKQLITSLFADDCAKEKQQKQQESLNASPAEAEGDLAVVYDQNLMEASGYASALATLSNERVWLAECSQVQWSAERRPTMRVRTATDQWRAIRACMRFVTQKPWQRMPLGARTRLVNPIVACLAGGRNKIMAAQAYAHFNEREASGLAIRLPYTLVNVSKRDIPRLVRGDPLLAGRAVIKAPYGNCGQDVHTVLDERELAAFMRTPHAYARFVVQALVGHRQWCEPLESAHKSPLYHVGTRPDAHDNTFAFDLRMTVASNGGASGGFCPVSINCRRARKPLQQWQSGGETSSWDVLGTNLSVRVDDTAAGAGWTTEPDRLLMLDTMDFERLGLDLDDLVSAYVQTVLSVVAIDQLCDRLWLADTNEVDMDLLRQLNPDEVLIDEIRAFNGQRNIDKNEHDDDDDDDGENNEKQATTATST